VKEYLLDTHTFLWGAVDTSKLSEKVLKIIKNRDNTLYLSSASVWEIVIKHSIDKLERTKKIKDLGEFIRECIARMKVTPLPITIPHVLEISKLPHIHKDPFDRVLVAQARIHGLEILTKDPNIPRYGVETIW